jgi:hypothetical protein
MKLILLSFVYSNFLYKKNIQPENIFKLDIPMKNIVTYSLSTTNAVPCPPPIHNVARPVFASLFIIS